MRRAIVQRLPPSWRASATRTPSSRRAAGSADPAPIEQGQRRGPKSDALVDALIRGESLEQAVTEYVRARVAGRSVGEARLLCEALLADPRTAMAGDLGHAVVASGVNAPHKAWHHFGRVSDEHWRRWAPVEYFRTAQAIGTDEVVVAATRLLDDPPGDVPASGWMAVAEATFGLGRYTLARRAHTIAMATADADAAMPAKVRWLGEWLERVERPQPSPAPRPGGIAFGVLDYKQPDRARASTSLDDYMQTLAVLGHLVRHQGVELAGPSDLVEFTDSLRGRVEPGALLDGAGEVTLVPVNRDASSLDPLPEPTWLLAVGEHMEPCFGTTDFPFSKNIRPLFISFHCSRPAILTTEAVEYLRRHAPIGCSDWSTVYLLYGAGIPAFFSGSVVATIDLLAPSERLDGPEPEPRVAFVGMPVPPRRRGEAVSHGRGGVRTAALCANLNAALGLVDDYRWKYSRVVTSQLQSHLLARAVGTPVKFTPANAADPRLNGLLGMDDTSFDRLRTDIDEKLASTLSLILSGAGEDEVYAHWRSICSRDVEVAHRRILDIAPLPEPSVDVAVVCRRIRSERVDIAAIEHPANTRPVDVTVALDGNLKRQLGVVLTALTTGTTRPLHLWIMCRDHGPADFDHMASAFPEVSFTWLPCDEVDYRNVKLFRHITAATLDRLLLPDLLLELDRIVYIDLDVLPLGDISELSDWDLDGAPLAACVARSMKPGYANILKLASFQWRRPALGDQLVRWMASKHAVDFDRYNAGVLVLDLARMREEEFAKNVIPFVDVYGFNDQIVLNLYTGSRYASLPPEWNFKPSIEHVDEPKLIHWAGPMKPWNQPMAPFAEQWRRFEAAYDERVAKMATPR